MQLIFPTVIGCLFLPLNDMYTSGTLLRKICCSEINYVLSSLDLLITNKKALRFLYKLSVVPRKSKCKTRSKSMKCHRSLGIPMTGGTSVEFLGSTSHRNTKAMVISLISTMFCSWFYEVICSSACTRGFATHVEACRPHHS